MPIFNILWQIFSDEKLHERADILQRSWRRIRVERLVSQHGSDQNVSLYCSIFTGPRRRYWTRYDSLNMIWMEIVFRLNLKKNPGKNLIKCTTKLARISGNLPNSRFEVFRKLFYSDHEIPILVPFICKGCFPLGGAFSIEQMFSLDFLFNCENSTVVDFHNRPQLKRKSGKKFRPIEKLSQVENRLKLPSSWNNFFRTL